MNARAESAHGEGQRRLASATTLSRGGRASSRTFSSARSRSARVTSSRPETQTVIAAGFTRNRRCFLIAQRVKRCRHDADETPHHGPGCVRTAQHWSLLETRTVQHFCAWDTMARHAFLVFPKPGVGCSIQPGGTTKYLHLAISCRAQSRTKLLNRQECRHSADETRQHRGRRWITRQQLLL